MVKAKVSPFLCRRIGEDTKEIFRESNNNEFVMCKVIVYVVKSVITTIRSQQPQVSLAVNVN